MEKIAQKRRLRNKLRELINIPGERIEEMLGTWSPQLKELMELLRTVDDNIREQATDLKNLLKLATTNYNRREYMVAVAFLGQFRDKLEAIDQELSKLGKATDIKHHEFLFGDMDQEYVNYLLNTLSPKLEQRRKPRIPAPLSGKRAFLVSEAGISDWWANLTTERGKALGAWEKRFPKQAKELKRQVDGMIKRAQGMYSFLLDTFKSLASFRATRSLEEYLKTAEKLQQKYKGFDANFSSFYDAYIKRFVDLQKEKATKELGTEAPLDEAARAFPVAKTDAPVAPAALPAAPVAQPSALKMTLPEPTTDRGFDEKWMQENEKNHPPAPKSPVKRPLAVLNIPGSSDETSSRLSPVQPLSPSSLTPIPPTEFDVGSTLRSPHAPDTLKEQEIELSHLPDTEETTLVSPQLGVSPRDKPIQVSVAPSKNPKTPPEITPTTQRSRLAFVQKLDKLASSSNFTVAAELIKYAETIKQEDPEVSQKLMQLAKSILEGS